jgi:hypothetical protein
MISSPPRATGVLWATERPQTVNHVAWNPQYTQRKWSRIKTAQRSFSLSSRLTPSQR